MAAKQGFPMHYSKGDAIGTKVSVRYRRSGRLSGVVVKRGSTVYSLHYHLLMLPFNCFHKTVVSFFRLCFYVSSFLQQDSDTFCVPVPSSQQQWAPLHAW